MQQSSGFTLIELMVTVSVAAIVLTVGIPAFQSVVRGNQLTSVTNDFVTAMTLARSEALKRGVSVSVVATPPSSSNEWGDGWRVVRADGTTLRTWEGAGDALTLDSRGDHATFVYDASGMVNSGDSIELCDDRTGETGREIDVRPTGRVQAVDLACS